MPPTFSRAGPGARPMLQLSQWAYEAKPSQSMSAFLPSVIRYDRSIGIKSQHPDAFGQR